ncbi:hypothetical protein LTR16_001414 [Cryomyces antarcticus]|uniref:Uncharacterized protein n=1 Tax=Cryomyces antarcticus TaxID=329879 RepID=A0ABR0LQ94_9PEZI|nr:hypothetical protein LTR60_000741 [Cryomyces antarcticus]KAK5201797.1 hypothetical protein LTR16_001414 [Cryomyces antarcticus]
MHPQILMVLATLSHCVSAAALTKNTTDPYSATTSYSTPTGPGSGAFHYPNMRPTTASTITSATDSILRRAYRTGTTIHIAPGFSIPSSLPTPSTQSKEDDRVGEEVDALAEKMMPRHASTYLTPNNDVRANMLPQTSTSLVSFKPTCCALTHADPPPKNNTTVRAKTQEQTQNSAAARTSPRGLRDYLSCCPWMLTCVVLGWVAGTCGLEWWGVSGLSVVPGAVALLLLCISGLAG